MQNKKFRRTFWGPWMRQWRKILF